MPVYVCSAFGGKEENLVKARKYCKWIMEETRAIPIAPHLLFPQFLDDAKPEEREKGVNAGLELLKICEEIFVFVEDLAPISAGMMAELRLASDLNIPLHVVDVNSVM
jgi:hypothetical protein